MSEITSTSPCKQEKFCKHESKCEDLTQCCYILTSPKLIDLGDSPAQPCHHHPGQNDEKSDKGKEENGTCTKNGDEVNGGHEKKEVEDEELTKQEDQPLEVEPSDGKDHSEAASLPDVASGLPAASDASPDNEENGGHAESSDSSKSPVHHGGSSPKSDCHETGEHDKPEPSPSKCDGKSALSAEDNPSSKADEEFVLCSATLKSSENETESEKVEHSLKPDVSESDQKDETSSKSEDHRECHSESAEENGVKDKLEQLNLAEGETEAPATSKKLCSPS